jgi:hypothetical protein
MDKGCRCCRNDLNEGCTEPIGSFKLNTFENDTCDVDIFIEEKDRSINAYLVSVEKFYKMDKINYCPMCGTNLKELYKGKE